MKNDDHINETVKLYHDFNNKLLTNGQKYLNDILENYYPVTPDDQTKLLQIFIENDAKLDKERLLEIAVCKGK